MAQDRGGNKRSKTKLPVLRKTTRAVQRKKARAKKNLTSNLATLKKRSKARKIK